MTDREYIEGHTLRCEYTRRGGGIEIDATDYLDGFELKMSAYQNYLGGGMLGAVGGSIQGHLRDADKATQAKALKLNEALKRYFHELTNDEAGDWDEWSSSDYEANQNRPESAY